MQVFLHNQTLLLRDLLHIVSQEDPSTLTHAVRLHYQRYRWVSYLRRRLLYRLYICALVCQTACVIAVRGSFISWAEQPSGVILGLNAFLLLVLNVLAELGGLAGPDPGAREELEFVREELTHAFEVASEESLAGNLVHGWIVINLLIPSQARQRLTVNTQIEPQKVPLRIGPVLVLTDPPAHILRRYLLDERVLCPKTVDHNAFLQEVVVEGFLTGFLLMSGLV